MKWLIAVAAVLILTVPSVAQEIKVQTEGSSRVEVRTPSNININPQPQYQPPPYQPPAPQATTINHNHYHYRMPTWYRKRTIRTETPDGTVVQQRERRWYR